MPDGGLVHRSGRTDFMGGTVRLEIYARDGDEGSAMLREPSTSGRQGLVYVVDSQGTFYRPSRVSRPAGELLQDLGVQPLSPADRISSILGYQIPADVVLDSVVYQSERDRFVPLADLTAAPASTAGTE